MKWIAILLMITSINMAQEAMTIEEHNAKLQSVRERSEIALPKIAQLKTKIAGIKEELNTVENDSRRVWREILDVVGTTQTEYDAYISSIEAFQNEVSGYQSTYAENNSAWAENLKLAPIKIQELKTNKISVIPNVDHMFVELETAINISNQNYSEAREQAIAETNTKSQSDNQTTQVTGKHTNNLTSNLTKKLPDGLTDKKTDKNSERQVDGQVATKGSSTSSSQNKVKVNRTNNTSATTKTESSVATEYANATITVTSGTSLWRLARRPESMGNPLRWKELYEANQDKIKDPHVIYPGQVLRIPR